MKIKKRSVVTIIMGLGLILCVNNAWAQEPNNLKQCIDYSGGRYNVIGSVKWACDIMDWENNGNNDNACSLWIGGLSSTDPTIYANNATGKVTVYYYGMCTKASAPTAEISVTNDNDSIDDNKTLVRGVWGSPTHVSAQLNIASFISGLTPEKTSSGDKYQRTVNVYRCHGYYDDDGNIVNNGSCSSENDTVTLIIRNKFAGEASASSGGASMTTGFVSEDSTANDLNVDCSSGECTVDFVLSLKSLVGNGNTSYEIYRGSTKKKNGTSTPGTSGSDVEEFTETMHPGDRICYSIKFNVSAASGAKATAKACAVATANVSSSLDIKVRDQSSSVGYRTWRSDFVYAKPDDAVDLVGIYDPVAQAAYGWKTASTKVIGESTLYANGGKTIGKTFDVNRAIKWDNAFTIYINDSFHENVVGEVGSNASYSNEDSPYTYTVSAGDVGKRLSAKSRTNYDMNSRRRVTPAAVSVTNVSGSSVAEVDINAKSSGEVYTYVPYNFNNNVDIITDDAEIHAGGGKEIEYNLHVGEKQNNETNGVYATKVKNASWKVSVKYGSSEYIEVAAGNGDLEPGDNNKYGNVSLPGNLAAGTNVCVRVDLSPANSGGDKNLEPSAFSGVATAEKCFTVAKKPSFQVWGGSVYSSGSINLGDYVIKKDWPSYSDNYMFGSWTELGLLANGSVKGFASGAGLGYTKDVNGNIFPSPYGDNSGAGSASSPGGAVAGSDLCIINTLSFSNSDCHSGSIGNAGITVDDNRGKLVNELESLEDEEVMADGLNYNCDSGCVLYGGTLMSGVKVIIERDNDLRVSGNIEYGTFSGDNLPKLFIYAKNINIDCGVSRVDAVLIADEYVNTCVSDDYNSAINSTQLKINGSVIANKLILNRTYGAGAGDYSIVPAEIINYDPTLYVWGRGRSEKINEGRYISEFMREMSPRY